MAEQGCKLFVYGVDENTANQELQVGVDIVFFSLEYLT